MIKYSIYKLGNLFNFGNSFFLCCNTNSFNYSIMKRKLNDYNIKEKMKNSLKNFPIIIEFHKKLFYNRYSAYIKKGFYISLYIYIGYKSYRLLKKKYFINKVEDKLFQNFYDNHKMINLLINTFDKLCEDDIYRKKIYKKLNSYIQNNYEYFDNYMNPLIISQLKNKYQNHNIEFIIIEIFKKTLLNNKIIQNQIIKYINLYKNIIDMNNKKKFLDFIKIILYKVFENEDSKEIFYTEFFNIFNKKLIEEKLIDSTSEFIENNQFEF